MKSLFSTFFLLSGFIVFCQTNDSITIKGITTEYSLFSDEKRSENVAIHVYEYNTKINSYKTDVKGKFEFSISKNSYTILEFVKDGFITKRMLFDMRTETEVKNVKPFNIEIIMIEAKKGIDYSNLDFPITYIKYIEDHKDFNYVEKYTQMMLKEQEKILAKYNKTN
jgi:hypothetical protein